MTVSAETEEGARIALAMCEQHRQLPLFGMTDDEYKLDGEFVAIHCAARQVLAEARMQRAMAA